MNRRQIVAGVPALIVTHRFGFALQEPPPSPDVERASVNEAARRWEAVWASDKFRTQLIHHKLDKTQRKSNQEVYDAIMAAHPKHANYALTNVANGSETAITSGTITGLQQTWVAAKGGEKINELVNTVAHEYTHTVEGGQFTHPYLQKYIGRNSVPIVVGDLTESIADEIFPPKILRRSRLAQSEQSYPNEYQAALEDENGPFH